MNKNTIIGSILIVGIMVLWMALAPKNQVQNTVPAAPQPAKSETISATAIQSVASSPVLPNKEEALVSDSAVVDSAEALPVILPRTVKVETEKFTMTLSNRGGKIQSVVVKTLPDSLGNFPELIQDTAQGALDLKLENIDFSDALFDLGETPEVIKASSDTTVNFVFTMRDGSKLVRSYGFSPSGVAVRQTNRFVNFKPSNYEMSWNGGMKETEEFPKGKSFGGASYFFSEVIFNNTSSIEREMIREKTTFDENKIRWAGMRRKYVAMSIQYDSPVGATLTATPMKVLDSDIDPGTYKLNLRDDLRSDSLAFNFMVLPLEWSAVEALDQGYEKVIVSGWTWCGADFWFVGICSIVLALLKFLYSIIPNYGVAIILVTIIVRLVTTPFTVKQLKSTRAMSALKPQLDEINVKYRSDPQKKQAAIMELYTKNNINPLASCTGGCLPMLIQMPIFMSLFFVLGRAIELRGMPAFAWITDLSRSDVIWSGLTIPYIMPDGLTLLPWIMVVSTYFQTKITMSTGMDPAQQKMMTWMMPAMMFFFSAVMPSGLVLYWIISNLWSIAQYLLINRKYMPATAGGKKIPDAKIVKK